VKPYFSLSHFYIPLRVPDGSGALLIINGLFAKIISPFAVLVEPKINDDRLFYKGEINPI
jgi:hypothetical protein